MFRKCPQPKVNLKATCRPIYHAYCVLSVRLSTLVFSCNTKILRNMYHLFTDKLVNGGSGNLNPGGGWSKPRPHSLFAVRMSMHMFVYMCPSSQIYKL